MLFCCVFILVRLCQSATLLSKNIQVDISAHFSTLKDLMKTQLISKNWIGVHDVFERLTPRAGLFEHKQTNKIILETKETSMSQIEIIESLQVIIGVEYDEINNRIKEKNWSKMFRSWIRITPWCEDYWAQDFLEAFADVVDMERIDKYERPRIHLVTECKNIGVVEALLKRPYVNPNVRDDRGKTVLHIVATWPHIAVRKWIRMLLYYGVDVDAADHEGKTALMHAVDWGMYWPVRSLLENGANPNLKSKRNETALYFAVNRRRSFDDIIQILLIHGAKIN